MPKDFGPPLPLMRPWDENNGPDGKRFVWGPIRQVHEIGNIQIVEFLWDLSTHSNHKDWKRHGKPGFDVWVDKKHVGRTCNSLDSALVQAIAVKRCGPMSQAAQMFDLMTLGVIPEEA